MPRRVMTDGRSPLWQRTARRKLRHPAGEELDQLGLLLGFTPAVEDRYEADTGSARVAHLRLSLVLGTVIYNLYNFTGAALMPDIVALGTAMRLVVITPLAVLTIWLIGRVNAMLREAAVTAGMVVAMAVPIFLVWRSASPTALYSVGEFPLTLYFGAMMVGLRFPMALAFAGSSSVLAILAFYSRPGTPDGLPVMFSLQFLTASGFAVYGNYRAERAGRLSYLAGLRAVLRSEGLETEKATLTELSGTDPLTGIANRRVLDDRLLAWSGRRHAGGDATPQAVFDAAMDGVPVALLMVDVDHFKKYNDTYGHPGGDACLQAVARTMAASLRAGDLLARYGGEEFAILLARADLAFAELTAERLREAVESMAIPHAGREDGGSTITVSVGIAVARAGGHGLAADLAEAADRALYLAKRRGRNRCVSTDASSHDVSLREADDLAARETTRAQLPPDQPAPEIAGFAAGAIA